MAFLSQLYSTIFIILCLVYYFSYTDILCAATMIVRKTKASEKTAALMLKTIVSIPVDQNLKIIYI